MADIAAKLEEARLLFEGGKPDQARQKLLRLAQHAPRDPGVASALSIVLTQLGQHAQALFHARRAAALLPEDLGVLVNLANSLASQHLTDEAVSNYEQATRLFPGNTEPLVGLSTALRNLARPAEAAAAMRAAIKLTPNDAALLGQLAGLLNYLDIEPGELFAAHRAYGDQLAATISPEGRSFTNAPDPNRVLRIGILSHHFRRHSLAYFLEPILRHLDRSRAHVVCCSTTTAEDDVTARLKSLADVWLQVGNLDDAALFDHLREARLDILIETSGLYEGIRLPALARGCAPVQLTYCGYPNTTGMSSIHGRIVDSVTDPARSESLNTERLFRLDPCFLCYQPPAEAPPQTGVPPDHIAFCCFNNAAKLTDRVFATWAEILTSVPESTLILKATEFRHASVRQTIANRLASRGIDAGRVRILEQNPGMREHLAQYLQATVALDPFPYCGTTTTCEALWMGVPVVTLEGATHRERVGSSLLRTVGLTDLIARTPEDYIRTTIDLARDRARLGTLRSSLRDTVSRSPLCDGAAFAHRFETALRSMWRDWCARTAPSRA